jgi:hypothetical protein
LRDAIWRATAAPIGPNPYINTLMAIEVEDYIPAETGYD